MMLYELALFAGFLLILLTIHSGEAKAAFVVFVAFYCIARLTSSSIEYAPVSPESQYLIFAVLNLVCALTLILISSDRPIQILCGALLINYTTLSLGFVLFFNYDLSFLCSITGFVVDIAALGCFAPYLIRSKAWHQRSC